MKKKCRACGRWKDASNYSRHTMAPDGLRPRCKKCLLAEHRIYRSANRERMAVKSLQRYYEKLRDDPHWKEQARKRASEWYEDHRTSILKARAKERAKREIAKRTPKGMKRCGKCERIKKIHLFPKDSSKKDGLRTTCGTCKKSSDKKWFAEHRDDRLRKFRDRYRANPEKHKAQIKAWAKANPKRYRARCLSMVQNRRARLVGASINDLTQKEWKAILKKANGICSYCLRPGLKLTMDHRIPLARGGNHTASNITAACGRCNSRKGTRTISEFYEYLASYEKESA